MKTLFRVVGIPLQTGAGEISRLFETLVAAQQHKAEKDNLRNGWEYRVITVDETGAEQRT